MQDALLPTLLAAILGGAVGAGLTAFLKNRRPRRPVRSGRACERAAARAATAIAVADARVEPPAALSRPSAADLLLVDDSAVARAKLRRLFESAGYAVHLACDGVQALELLEKGRYALMVTDLEMPQMDGATLIDNCRERPHTARMPIVAISGHESLRAKFNECRDISGIHPKPWADDILLSHVATLVAGRRLPAAAAVAG